MKRLLLYLLLIVILPTVSYSKVVDFIAAVVNGEPVLYSEVVKFAKEKGINDLRVARDRLIEKKILLTEAKKKGLKVSDRELQRALKDLIERSGFKSEKEFEEALKREGLTIKDVKEKLREQLLITKLIAKEVKSKVEVSPVEVEKYCRKVESKPVREVYYIYTTSQETAEKALSLLKEGVSFEKVARELSQDRATAERGGYIGRVTRGMLVKPLDEAIWSLKPGQYKLVRTDKGYFIVFVKSEETGKCDREKIKQEIYMRKFQKALKDYTDRLKKEASVKVYM
ncbi:peptidyl-prolyl cis-trans isomerase C/peptidyl-prolyl cis-trans isomerase SurA [Thermovibrio guaymasensis]|uniref:Peptidyl-prolyl cis-trans isomerase C/peptidyl-prolyl cis-trans isomerase SurA n=1 Tax=Thermovibrio guaymasensis TaxID=240167 RepID=A0A420W8X1_9BACT|nr:peptidylprolyl isomerase [Thermovibrio guaymasensis]RKQ63757.1 peptidyl-prolyl cis-trans isomerase C/peptidyl-prolyl cis-trans isomerase SurA [Thermovibrio guaymasensis]